MSIAAQKADVKGINIRWFRYERMVDLKHQIRYIFNSFCSYLGLRRLVFPDFYFGSAATKAEDKAWSIVGICAALIFLSDVVIRLFLAARDLYGRRTKGVE